MKLFNGKGFALAFTLRALKSLLLLGRQSPVLVALSLPTHWLALIPAVPEYLLRFSPFTSRWQRMRNWLLRQLSLLIPQLGRLCKGER